MYVGGPYVIVLEPRQRTRPALVLSLRAAASSHPELSTPVRVSVALKEGLRERTLKRRSIPPPADRVGERVVPR
jgi:hypothetical protein